MPFWVYLIFQGFSNFKLQPSTSNSSMLIALGDNQIIASTLWVRSAVIGYTYLCTACIHTFSLLDEIIWSSPRAIRQAYFVPLYLLLRKCNTKQKRFFLIIWFQFLEILKCCWNLKVRFLFYQDELLVQESPLCSAQWFVTQNFWK